MVSGYLGVISWWNKEIVRASMPGMVLHHLNITATLWVGRPGFVSMHLGDPNAEHP